MINKYDVIQKIEDCAPLSIAESWDNSGWQIKLANENVEKVMLCVSVTNDVVVQAIEKNVDLIIAHHPLIFPNIKRIDDYMIELLVNNNIQVYSAHTNFDKAGISSSGILAKELGFNSFYKKNDFLVYVDLEKQENLDDILLKLKIALNVNKIKVVNYKTGFNLKKIAFCAGSGADFIKEIMYDKIDLYVTSDVKYHDALMVKELTIADVGHLETEKPLLKIFLDLLTNLEIEVFIADEKTIWNFI